jgi:spore coat protein H
VTVLEALPRPPGLRIGIACALLLVGWVSSLAGAGPGGAGTSAQDAASGFFATGAVPHLRIQIARTNVAKLRRDARAYVRATVTEGDRVYEGVGIHLKGAAGSFRPIDDPKPALTLNFDKFADHQKFHGLDKLSLNNSVQDASYLTEGVCAELFLAAGVPTPRVTFARVELNGRDLGVYVLKEGFDKTFLKRHFRNPHGNLYDGGFLREITEPLERTSGDNDVPNRADLRALAAAAMEPDLQRRVERLEHALDVDRFITFSVIEMLTWHWDGYTLKKNNYRVYHDPESNRMVFFPHGMDQMFWNPNERIVPRPHHAEGLIARALLETSEGQKRYQDKATSLVASLFTMERLTNLLFQFRARLRPELAAYNADAARENDFAFTNLLHQVVARVQRAQWTVSEPEPEPIRFNAAGESPLDRWTPLDIRGTGHLDRTTNGAAQPLLHISAGPGGRCTASWRTRVLLPPGRYVFVGRLRTAGVTPLEKDVNTKGVGAGLRQSSSRQPRKHGLAGDSDWQTVEYEFVVPSEAEEVSLLCELRGEKGEAWFDLSSLMVKRVR